MDRAVELIMGCLSSEQDPGNPENHQRLSQVRAGDSHNVAVSLTVAVGAQRERVCEPPGDDDVLEPGKSESGILLPLPHEVGEVSNEAFGDFFIGEGFDVAARTSIEMRKFLVAYKGFLWMFATKFSRGKLIQNAFNYYINIQHFRKKDIHNEAYLELKFIC